MADAPGVISTTQAAALLMIGEPEVARLARGGWFKPVSAGRWRLVDIVQGNIRYLRSLTDSCSTKDLAATVGLTKTRLYQLADGGWIKSIGKDVWNREESVRGVIRFLRDEQRRSVKSAADGRVRDARASEIELKNAERSRHLITLDEAVEAITSLCGFIRIEFSGLAARVTRDLALRAVVEKAVNDILARISTRLEQEAATLRIGSKATAAVAELNA